MNSPYQQRPAMQVVTKNQPESGSRAAELAGGGAQVDHVSGRDRRGRSIIAADQQVALVVEPGRLPHNEAVPRQLNPDSGSESRRVAAKLREDRGGVGVYAAVIETLIGFELAKAGLRDPDLDHQHLSAARALRELNRIRRVKLTANGRRIDLTTRRTLLQARTLTATRTDTRTWDKATIT